MEIILLILAFLLIIALFGITIGAFFFILEILTGDNIDKSDSDKKS